jgi:delta14-sterol reductase
MQSRLLPLTLKSLEMATWMVLGFIGVLFVSSIMLPGLERRGYLLPNGETKAYKLTGMTFFFLTHIVVGIATFGFGISLTPIVQHFWSLFIVANVIAVIWSLALYVYGKRGGTVLKSKVGNGLPGPSWVKDLWFGNELNPTWLGVDLKMFMYQPSLIGVYLIVLAFAYTQYDRHGFITPQMWCFVGFWFVYLFTHYVKEEFMLSTWDITDENFGFMLVWGDLIYVPFLYSLPGFWIVDETTPFATMHWLALTAFFLIALIIFRGANWQKDSFKRDPHAKIWGKPAKTIGGKLLVSGWWGIGRKLNYTGEIGVYLSFALCAGVSHWQPFLLPLSLFLLLTQRAARDDKKCRAKYGPLWAEYCRTAKFRMIPFIY